MEKISIFQSAHPSRGATCRHRHPLTLRLISIRAPLAGCDFVPPYTSRSWPDFNPRTPRGVRPNLHRPYPTSDHFNPRTPRGVRHQRAFVAGLCGNFNPRTPRGVRLKILSGPYPMTVISIRAPLAGCDSYPLSSRHPPRYFNPRTPRGVRLTYECHHATHDDFNPRTPRGVRPLDKILDKFLPEISIRAPLAGCDQSICRSCRDSQISIRAPLAGCDVDRTLNVHMDTDFNPRTPRGVRLMKQSQFQSSDFISIRAPLAGCDRKSDGKVFDD